jgi:multidrug efflux pump subunit AcrB
MILAVVADVSKIEVLGAQDEQIYIEFSIIILACSFVSLGVRPGTVVALAIPLTMAVVFAVMNAAKIDLHRISLGA